MFWDNLLAPSSEEKISKGENTADFFHFLLFYKGMMFWKSALFPFSGKEVPNLVYSNIAMQ